MPPLNRNLFRFRSCVSAHQCFWQVGQSSLLRPRIHKSSFSIETLDKLSNSFGKTLSHTIIMAEPTAADGGDGELKDEIWGNLRLRRSRSKSTYYGVTKVNSKKNPWQAWVKSSTRQQQSLGCFSSAHRAAVEVANALAQNSGEDLDSPRKQQPRGALAIHPRCTPRHLSSCAMPSRWDCQPARQLSSKRGCSCSPQLIPPIGATLAEWTVLSHLIETDASALPQ